VARFANSWGVNLNLVTLVCSDVLTETEVFLQHVHVKIKQIYTNLALCLNIKLRKNIYDCLQKLFTSLYGVLKLTCENK